MIKASGLAAGKGVLIPANKEEALNALKEIMIDRVFGNAGMVRDFLKKLYIGPMNINIIFIFIRR